ncbi:hypothetical protein Y1Q_0017334 [Alligator mississippiensis]|uniref:Reverse transcriptase RNase H-like domain-containing protein n=1 Tax=Alligator mississippiensis TaxID=8496 RepID=A0A151NLJ3_ALLMI|nr:hypothetical protein Y1Q_0017334 [Alligator mississippiensis]
MRLPVKMDASNHALGVVLTQVTDGVECPIAYANRKLNPQEQRYATAERKCLAIKWGIEYFQYYLLGRMFTLVTDHPFKVAADHTN